MVHCYKAYISRPFWDLRLFIFSYIVCPCYHLYIIQSTDSMIIWAWTSKLSYSLCTTKCHCHRKSRWQSLFSHKRLWPLINVSHIICHQLWMLNYSFLFEVWISDHHEFDRSKAATKQWLEWKNLTGRGTTSVLYKCEITAKTVQHTEGHEIRSRSIPKPF